MQSNCTISSDGHVELCIGSYAKINPAVMAAILNFWSA